MRILFGSCLSLKHQTVCGACIGLLLLGTSYQLWCGSCILPATPANTPQCQSDLSMRKAAYGSTKTHSFTELLVISKNVLCASASKRASAPSAPPSSNRHFGERRKTPHTENQFIRQFIGKICQYFCPASSANQQSHGHLRRSFPHDLFSLFWRREPHRAFEAVVVCVQVCPLPRCARTLLAMGTMYMRTTVPGGHIKSISGTIFCFKEPDR